VQDDSPIYREGAVDVEPPSRMGEAVELLRAAFVDVVGVDLAEEPTVEYVHRLEFAHGGTSGGMIGAPRRRQSLFTATDPVLARYPERVRVSRLTSRARRAASNCSRVRGPTMGAVTEG